VPLVEVCHVSLVHVLCTSGARVSCAFGAREPMAPSTITTLLFLSLHLCLSTCAHVEGATDQSQALRQMT
jgi:hypothetical protein